jgi:hypothetical protein
VEACLGALQGLANGAAFIANLLPFSTVQTFEDAERGPVVRVRALLAGTKVHTEAHCQDATLVATELAWGQGSEVPLPLARGSLDAALGLLLLGAMQGAFDEFAGTTSAPESPGLDAAVESALADALAAAGQPAPAGPPLTEVERQGLLLDVQACWSVDPGSEAARATVTVGFALDTDGRVVSDVRSLGALGGTEAGQEAAFQAARRAILRCQRDGYDLPLGKHDQRREVEMTFNAEGMTVR